MILVVSAIPSELEKIIELSGAVECSDENGMFVSKEFNLLLTAIGIGYLNAALALQELLIRRKDICQVIFCGTAGVYPDFEIDIPMGASVCAKGTALFDGASELGASQYPLFLKEESYLCEPLVSDDHLPVVQVATLLGITGAVKLARKISNEGACHVENMELFGVAKVCFQTKLRCSAMLGITNVVGIQGHQQWKDNHNRVEQMNAENLFSCICQLKE